MRVRPSDWLWVVVWAAAAFGQGGWASEKRRPTVYLFEEFPTAYRIPFQEPFTTAILKGSVSYCLESSHGSDVAFEIETALRMWLIALGLDHVKVERSYFQQSADFLVRLGSLDFDGSKWKGNLGQHSWNQALGKHMIEVAEGAGGLHQPLPAVSIQDALRDGWIGNLRKFSAGLEKRPYGEVFQNFETPDQLARHLLRSKIKIAQNQVFLGRKKGTPLLTILLHEFGHLFGLNDLYYRPEPGFALPAPKYNTIMSLEGEIPIYPPAIDVKRIRHLLQKFGMKFPESKCSNLLK